MQKPRENQTRKGVDKRNLLGKSIAIFSGKAATLTLVTQLLGGIISPVSAADTINMNFPKNITEIYKVASYNCETKGGKVEIMPTGDAVCTINNAIKYNLIAFVNKHIKIPETIILKKTKETGAEITGTCKGTIVIGGDGCDQKEIASTK